MSDYGYAVGGENRNSCLNNTNIYNYGEELECQFNNWLITPANSTFLLTPHASTSSAYDIGAIGYYGAGEWYSASANLSIRPTVYLIPTTKLTGDGTPSNPFVVE